jgi:hypothetical protein
MMGMRLKPDHWRVLLLEKLSIRRKIDHFAPREFNGLLELMEMIEIKFILRMRLRQDSDALYVRPDPVKGTAKISRTMNKILAADIVKPGRIHIVVHGSKLRPALSHIHTRGKGLRELALGFIDPIIDLIVVIAQKGFEFLFSIYFRRHVSSM